MISQTRSTTRATRISAATAVPAYAGIPLTARGVASTVAFATGHEADDKRSPVDWSAVARADTVVLFMAVNTARECCQRLIAADSGSWTYNFRSALGST